eukprot:scaffold7350_cov176-Skeletonema_marinoi.AAC.3
MGKVRSGRSGGKSSCSSDVGVNQQRLPTYILPTCEAKYLSATAHIILCLLHSREKLTSRHQPPALPYFLPDSTPYIYPPFRLADLLPLHKK